MTTKTTKTDGGEPTRFPGGYILAYDDTDLGRWVITSPDGSTRTYSARSAAVRAARRLSHAVLSDPGAIDQAYGSGAIVTDTIPAGIAEHVDVAFHIDGAKTFEAAAWADTGYTCRVCGQTLPVNRFPTVRGPEHRSSRCRRCRDARLGDDGTPSREPRRTREERAERAAARVQAYLAHKAEVEARRAAERDGAG